MSTIAGLTVWLLQEYQGKEGPLKRRDTDTISTCILSVSSIIIIIVVVVVVVALLLLLVEVCQPKLY